MLQICMLFYRLQLHVLCPFSSYNRHVRGSPEALVLYNLSVAYVDGLMACMDTTQHALELDQRDVDYLVSAHLRDRQRPCLRAEVLKESLHHTFSMTFWTESLE